MTLAWYEVWTVALVTARLFFATRDLYLIRALFLAEEMRRAKT